MYCALVFLAVAVLSVSAQAPVPCEAPPAFYGKLFEIDTKRTFDVFANYTYDRIGERLRIDESVATNRSETREYYDVFLFFKDRIEYRVNLNTKFCTKVPMPESAKFYPIEVPPSAKSRGLAVIGTNAGQAIGVTVELWSGSTERGRYFGSWTDVSCLPVHNYMTFPNGDALRQSFYDVTLGYDPNRFIPPANCQ